MSRRDVMRLARRLMDKHGLEHWSLRETRANLKAGRCDVLKRVIRVNVKLLSLNDRGVTREVVLHEIAHALTPFQGHNMVWEKCASSIGCRVLSPYADQINGLVVPPTTFEVSTT